ncbi:alanine--tRNA ligase [Candidatus Azambacteria bacterium]|nr:alanine--tRNA ligase [Candidatus Azambacteria bacterium]
MTSAEIRKRFLEFFAKRGHVVVPSSSLLSDDPTVLLTTAGMQQFKLYYTGARDPGKDIHPTLEKPLGARRAASVQKSFRTSDVELVGDESHLTFFEMLGNFSFGPAPAGYFKKEAIEWGYEFITKEMGLEVDAVSVFAGDPSTSSGQAVPFDQESYEIWKGLGIPEEKIKRAGREDNFWGPTGAEGPCGPTTEIYVDGLEVWNIVFNEYYCHPDKTLTKLESPGVDTGMGLERLAMVSQNLNDVFQTDLFRPVLEEIRGDDIRAKRIIADHLRGATVLISDGVLPSNIGAGYILRRLLRRAIRYGKVLGLKRDFYVPIVKAATIIYKDQYPEVRNAESDILTVIQNEEERFGKALEQGLKEFERLVKDGISGVEAFRLYESYGFPFELTQELAKERGVEIAEEDFRKEFERHQDVSRAGAEKKFGGHGLKLETGELHANTEEEVSIVTRLHTATHLLQAALRNVLGPEVKQMGSDITPERTRFDFTFSRKLTAGEVKAVEDLVNEQIRKDLPVASVELPLEEAKKTGALYFFKEKYPPVVTVYSIGPDPSTSSGLPFSREFCGGPHVTRTGEIGRFRITKEESSSAGVRRIRAIVE